ncbi:hypothetical protein [Peredibacter starrii]|uniref:Uncharacterized protein n=1 Tax=Peredibacter starrii TaxID=28202 RepID=A0AAX4HQ83_9BACT|nr:hypothetical protein [Peredibacter starrii]WPU65503.1 hypothetical protein SOO65_01960 [Peredibacter starrii]
MSGMTSPSYNQDFLVDTIGLTLEFLSDIILDIQTIGEFSPEREFFWNRKISKLTQDIGQFVELTTLLSKTIMSRKQQTIPGIKESHIHLLFILKAMNQAQTKQDLVALEELIKYELKDNLTQWKIDLIPQTKKLLNT